jgi:hypothetical protein
MFAGASAPVHEYMTITYGSLGALRGFQWL